MAWRSKKQGWRRGCLAALAGCAVLLALPLLFGGRTKRPGDGFACSSGLIPVATGGVKLLVDRTAYDTRENRRVIDQQIFDHILDAIRNAQQFVYADYFLWNDWQGPDPETFRLLSTELADALIRRKQERPEMDILVLTDPLNRIYGDHLPEHFVRMQRAGIPVVFTDLNRLPDSNLVYSRMARFFGPAIMHIPGARGWLKRPRFDNLFDQDGALLSGHQLARLLFFKANHRKVLICDRGDTNGLRMIIGSLNPGDSSSAHGNIGLQLDGKIAAAALRCELACVEASTQNADHVLPPAGEALNEILFRIRSFATAPVPVNDPKPDTIYAEWLTENAIRRRVVEMLHRTGPGDKVRIALFYLSDRAVISAIKQAGASGAAVRLLLDPNKDAFGRTKNGVPNRPVAAELMAFAQKRGADAQIRWADTHGEQFHAKAMSISRSQPLRSELICGSANWTRRNIGGYNLEADVYLLNAHRVTRAFNEYFDRAWNNQDGLSHSVDYEHYAESGWRSLLNKLTYRFQERTGAGTF
jgi:phosphatidylserine/phosphatidylglycerophosphate/cardiolipin synthase-like enzyme